MSKGICPGCDGAKIVDNQPCVDCGGTGTVEIINPTGVSKPWKTQK